MRTVRWFSLLLLALTLVAPHTAALGQEFPTRLVRVVVPYPAGGGVDGLARAIADRLSRAWRQPVIVENKPGASTMIGGEFVARAAADGYTLFFTSDSSITSNPFLFKKPLFDPIKDLAPVTQIIDLHQMIVVHPSVPANTVKELVALAKEKPNSLNYGSYGNGSQPHLLFEMLKAQTGVSIMQISYRGIAPALTATLANEVQMTLGGAGTTLGHIEAGKLKALALSRKTRLKALPQVPTLEEAGFPDIDPRSWFGLFAPAATPRAVIDRIQQDVAAILNDPEFKERYIEGPGYTGIGNTAEDFAAFIRADLAYKQRLIAGAGVTANKLLRKIKCLS
jgi:tripartite-type tricarboxylate transporter receptor subunit TctC